MLFLASNAADSIVFIFSLIMVLIVGAGALVGMFYFIAGFVQMNEGKSWSGLNVSGFGAICMMMTFMYYNIVFFSTPELNFYQSNLSAMMFVGIFIAIVGFLRWCSIPFGIIFLMGLIFTIL